MDPIKHLDLRQISFQEFGDLLVILETKIKKYLSDNKLENFDLIVPILRSGGFPGLYLASKLKTHNILPAQYKYIYKPDEKIIKKFDFPKLNFYLPLIPNILIVDTNTVYGTLATHVIEDVCNLYPQANLFFASVTLDQSRKSFPNVKEIFYAKETNEKRDLSSEEAKLKNIDNEIVIFPWENLEEQWIEISGGK